MRPTYPVPGHCSLRVSVPASRRAGLPTRMKPFAGCGAGTSVAMKSLIVAPAWIGDMVMAHRPLVQLFATGASEHGDSCRRRPSATAPLAERMPGVAGVHELGVGHGELGLRRRWRLASSLRWARFPDRLRAPEQLQVGTNPLLGRSAGAGGLARRSALLAVERPAAARTRNAIRA